MVSFSGTGSYFRHTTQQYLSPRLCSQMTSFLPGCHNTLYWQPLCLCELIMATSTSSPSWVLAQACPIAATLLLARLPPPIKCSCRPRPSHCQAFDLVGNLAWCSFLPYHPLPISKPRLRCHLHHEIPAEYLSGF